MSVEKISINETISKFKEWLNSDEVIERKGAIKKERKKIKELMSTLQKMDKESSEFTEHVFNDLLPNKSQSRRAGSIWGVYASIIGHFKKTYEYDSKELNLVANMIFSLSERFEREPDKLNQWIKEFTNKDHSKGLQCGTITPILFCIDKSFPIINSQVIATYKRFSVDQGWNDKISPKLEEYPDSILKCQKLIRLLDIADLESFDLFCGNYAARIKIIPMAAQLIDEIHVENFKGIKNLKLTDLKQFNVFIGKNDVGKSTLLESIFAFKPATLRSHDGLQDFQRILRTSRKQDAGKLFYNHLSDIPTIKILSNDEKAEITFNSDHVGSLVMVNTSALDVQMTVSLNQTFTEIISKSPVAVLPTSFEWINQMQYFDYVTSKNLPLLEENIGDADIVDEYDSDIDKIQKITYSGQQTRLAIRKNNVEIIVDDLGDGHKSALSLLALCKNMGNTILLIEEIESNHYPKSLRKLISKLVKLCNDNNIQVFVTTHSPEVLEHFSKNNNTKLIHLEKTNRGITTNEILSDDYTMWKDIGWEITNYLRHEKIIIVEGETDQIIFRHAFKQIYGYWPEEVGINFINARGKGTKQKELLKGLAYKNKTVFYQTDLDKDNESNIKDTVISYFQELSAEGDILVEQDKVSFTHKLGTQKILKKNNILITGDTKLTNIDSHAIEDYLLDMLLENPTAVADLGGYANKLTINAKDGKEILHSVFSDYNSEKIVQIMEKCNKLPDNLISIVERIHDHND